MKDLSTKLASGDIKTLGQDAINQQVAKNSVFPSLTLKQRVIGFAICIALATLFGILAYVIMIIGNALKFSIPYSICVLCLLGSTLFLIGPLRQLKLMFHKTRVITTIIFLLAIAMTIVSAFIIKSSIMVLLFVIIQILAFVWYALSYIPYARTAVIKFVKHGCRRV